MGLYLIDNLKYNLSRNKKKKFIQQKLLAHYHLIFILKFTIYYHIISSIYKNIMKKQRTIKMDFIERITLSPFQKYTQFNVFPWKFIFHLLLVVLCTYQALKIVSIQDKHTRIQQQVFSTIYLQNEDGTNSYPYYSLTDFTDTFFDVLEQTNELNSTLLQYSDISDVHYRLEVYYSEMDLRLGRRVVFQGNASEFVEELDEIPLHDGNYSEMKEFIQEVQSMKLQISNLITYISMDDKNRMNQCLNWTVKIDYSFQSFANVQSQLEALSQDCKIRSTKNPNSIQSDEDISFSTKQSLITINISVMLISVLSLIASWKQIYQISKQYMIYKKALTSNLTSALQEQKLKANVDWRKNWQELGFFDKMKFFDFWFVTTVAGNFFQLFGAFVSVLDEIIATNLVIFEHKEFMIGFGVMLAWITMLKYLQYSNNLNLMTSTLSKSYSNLFMFLMGVMPFFLGFVFLGQTIFWKYSKFQNTSSSAITLFSLLNGDIVNDTFLETWAEGIVGQVYLIIFMILFYTAVQNVFVTIIMEGYEESIKEREYKKMIEQKQQKQKAQRYQNILNLTIQQQQSLVLSYSPQMSPEQQSSYAKLKLNGKKIDKILNQIIKLKDQVRESDLSGAQKKYITGILKQNLESVSHSLKLQLKQMNTNSLSSI